MHVDSTPSSVESGHSQLGIPLLLLFVSQYVNESQGLPEFVCSRNEVHVAVQIF